MSDIPVVHINCWPSIRHPFTIDERLDHDMRVKHCEEVMSRMSEEERRVIDTPEGWSAFLKEHWEYDPEGYVRPPEVSDEQREEWADKLKRRYYVVDGHGLVCEDCGKRSPSVKHTTCPFDEEVYDKITECDLCPECERERARDI